MKGNILEGNEFQERKLFATASFAPSVSRKEIRIVPSLMRSSQTDRKSAADCGTAARATDAPRVAHKTIGGVSKFQPKWPDQPAQTSAIARPTLILEI